MPWTTLKNTLVYDNPWISVSHRTVINPAGNPGIYGKVHFKNLAIGILPLDENLNTWLVGQHRYPLDQYSWEIPEGGAPIGSDPLESAMRELREETGLLATEWTELMRLHLSNSVSDEAGLVFIARGLKQGEADPEETEDLKIRKLAFSEAFEMVIRGEITDAISVAAILKAHLWISQGQIKNEKVYDHSNP